jgi:MFS transporter, MCT family, solute carrier family 16 (monocarboxylic acid transporters), member 10
VQVFQAYYEIIKFPDQSPASMYVKVLSTLRHPNSDHRAWIGSTQYFFIFAPGIFIGKLFDRGYFRLPFMLANTVLILATFLVAECTAFWQVVLCHGILTGVACGVMFSPIFALTSQWFDKRRQLVFGLISIGSSVGGTVVPILVRALLPAVG